MSDPDDYLRVHYLGHMQFAARCAISAGELDRLLELALVPQPAYVVTADGVLESAAFGRLEAVGAPPGRYFHPGCASWVRVARQVEGMVGTRLARHALKQQFVSNFVTAFAECCRQLRDTLSPDDDGVPAGLDARAEAAWLDFRQGIFGVCVSDPSSERSIARKEALQSTLSRLTDDGRKPAFTAAEAARIRTLIEDYAQCAMPFAPPEYPRSSRRRLVDDLRQVLARPAIRP